ncbi:sensor histidine kinase [Pseudobacter ginsenosidimutans]|uniref:Histidine kinase n=1 Tax=Pseudobacter ginsenosidimutans TaxID=661488 RepID=A0A4Q7N656_9BACT|nr:histidine kinase [Pseudobacter ginsenosidimutans]QEC45060.1 hypothetical protein FSB84_26490 [Pseudobacter ginsenosidimutans]RZS76555.1 histidine kinase [Pseudobacter ginsenosidimutans]
MMPTSMKQQDAQLQHHKIRIILLAATAIAVFMALPRLAIILYVRSLPFSLAASQQSWTDFFLKFIFGWLVALVFLFLNTSRKRLSAGSLAVELGNFRQRLLLNLFLFVVVRWLAMLLGLDGAGFAFNEKFYGFLLNITLILEICFCILVAEAYMLVMKNQAMKLRNEILQKINAESSFEALKNQVNPHFLFNSLTAISSMMDTDREAAKHFLNNMSQVYRYVLQSQQAPLVSFREELAFSMAWVNMMRERYNNRFSLETNIEALSLTRQLPPMALQTLVENAFKHNVVSASAPLSIQISARGNELTVTNNLQERSFKEAGTGTGLYNLNKRYLHICGQEIRIIRKDSIFSVTLPLLNEAS